MNEIYWITRCDSIHTIGIIMTIISFALFIIFWIVSISKDEYTGEDNCSKNQKRKLRKGARYSIFTFIVGLLIWSFIPTERDAFFIYGVGGTVDYIKNNPTARQLPDKCINALDKWADSLNNDSIK